MIKRTGNKKIAVVGWGRGMGHKGHMYLADAVITQAQGMSADPYFFVSKTVGKDDPLYPEEKLKIYQRVFPQQATIFTAQGNLNDALKEVAALGYEGVVLVVGADQKQSFQYLERPNKEGVPVYQSFGFKKLRVISRQETRSQFASEEGPRATPMREILLHPEATEEQKFKVWRRDMPEKLGDQEVLDLMHKAEARLMGAAAKKATVKEFIELVKPMLSVATGAQKVKLVGLLESAKKQLVESTVIETEEAKKHDPELDQILNYAQQHYPGAADKTEAFVKFVIHSLRHSEEDDKHQDQEINDLEREVDSIQNAMQGVTETALQGKDDLAAKRKALQDLEREPGVDQAAVRQRKLDLDKEARAQGLDESPEEALKYATQAHAGQTRSGGDPYISHPVRVANHIKQFKQSHNLDALISAAYLHDTIEDTDTTQEILHDLFGGLVASLVKELTSDPEEIKKVGKAQYLSHKMAAMSSYALVIKLADRLDNVKDITTARTPQWRAKYAAETNQILNYIEKTRALSGTHNKLIELIRAKLAEIDNPQQGVAEAEIDRPGMKDGRPYSDPYRRHPGNSSYMTPEYLIQKYKERLEQIATGPYKRPKEVAQLQSRIAKLEKQSVAEAGITRRGILKGIAGAGALGAAGKASAIAGAFPTPSHQAAMYKAAADSNAAQARADAAAKAKADAERLRTNSELVDKEQRVNHHKLDEFAPGNGDDGLPYAEYQVYQCNPEDQFDWIGGPLYQTDSMGMAHKYAYEKYVKHRPKAFMVWQERSQGSRGNYGVKGESDHDEGDLKEDYIDEK